METKRSGGEIGHRGVCSDAFGGESSVLLGGALSEDGPCLRQTGEADSAGFGIDLPRTIGGDERELEGRVLHVDEYEEGV